MPDKLGHFLNKFLGDLIGKKFIFLRCDCDHFSPLSYLFIYLNSPQYTAKKKSIEIEGFKNLKFYGSNDNDERLLEKNKSGNIFIYNS